MRILLTLAGLFIVGLLPSPAAPSAIFPELDLTRSARGLPRTVLDAYQAKRYEEALTGAQALADQGNPFALFFLGWLHENGLGTPADPGKAASYYQLSSTAGHPKAIFRQAAALLQRDGIAAGPIVSALLEAAAAKQPGPAALLLGHLHAEGMLSESPDFQAARHWLTLAGQNGEPEGNYQLGRLLDGSFGFPDSRDPAAALAAFRRAAEQGLPDAMAALGSRLLNGEKKLRNKQEGVQWLEKAGEAGAGGAYLVLGYYYEYSNNDSEAALTAFMKGVALKNPKCLLEAARHYRNGLGTTPDPAKALDLFQESGRLGNAEGLYEAARMQLRDAKDQASLLSAYQTLLASALANLPQAQNELGAFYLAGRLGSADPSAAASWFDHAAAQDFAPAENNLAMMFEQGLGVPQNLKGAIKFYTLAAKKGHAEATTAIARMHADGIGIKPDLKQAWALATLAVERGSTNARALQTRLQTALSEEELREARKILTTLQNIEPK